MEYLICKTFNRLSKDSTAGNSPYARRVSRIPAKISGRTVTGYASVFGSPDNENDIVMPGAFAKSIALFKGGRSRCRFLWNHDAGEPPIANILEIKEVTRDEMPVEYLPLTNVSGALQVTRQYFTDSHSDRVFQGVLSGAIVEMSFAYNIVRSSFADMGGKRVRILEELELFDASDVNWGMHPDTSATIKGPQVRNAVKAKRDRELELQRQALGRLTADTNYLLSPRNLDAEWLDRQSSRIDFTRARAEIALLEL